MNPVDLILAAEALTSGRVRPRRLFRHVHLEAAPLAIAAVQMANEPYSLWAALVGRSPAAPRLIVAPEPRNRDIAFQVLVEVGSILCAEVDAAARAPRIEVCNRKGAVSRRCSTAPQLLVANASVIEFLGRLGRRMRPAGYRGRVSVPPVVNTAGAHLGFFAEAVRYPGSALVVVATNELSRHGVTGQSAVENAHLGAQLPWWDPSVVERIAPGRLGGRAVAGLHGAEAAAAIESIPMGALTDPEYDNGKLVDAVTRFNQLRAGATDPATVARLGSSVVKLLEDAIRPTWRALWEAHAVLCALRPAPGAERRWEADLKLFTRHADYIAGGGHRASVDSARRAAMLLADRERAHAAVMRDETLEDPLGFAAAIAEGYAARGTIVSIDPLHQEPGPSGKRSVTRPLVEIALDDECPFPAGTELWWTEAPGRVKVVVESARPAARGGTIVLLKVIAGMCGALPRVGAQAAFSVYTTAWMPPAPLPASTPWTHVPDRGTPGDDGAELDGGPALDGPLGLGGARVARKKVAA